MKNKNLACTILIITILLAACTPKAQKTATPSPTPPVGLAITVTSTNAGNDYIPLAQTVIDQLNSGNSEPVYALFDDAMRAAITADQLKVMWPQLESQAGAFQTCYGWSQQELSGYQVVLALCTFKAAGLNMSLSFDSTGKVGGMYFKPATAPTPSADTYQALAYVDKTSFTEREVTVGSGQWALPGTLSIPNGSGPFPAVVLVHGSGPNDHDETIGPNKPFRDLAWGLASRGIAVLRFDKRTLVHADLFTPDVLKTLTLQQETIDDALLAAELLRQTKNVDPEKIYVLGHSLGALAAPGRMGAIMA